MSPQADLDLLVNEVGAAHAGVRSRWQPPVAGVPGLAERLTAAGYATTSGVRSMDRPAGQQSGASAARGTLEVVDSEAGLEAWYQVRLAAGRCAALPSLPSLRAQLAVAAASGRRYTHLLIRSEGEAVAAGALWMAADFRAGLLCGGAVVPHRRGEGHYRALIEHRIGAIIRLAAMHDCRSPQVVVSALPGASQAIFRHLGFRAGEEYLVADRPAVP